MTEHIDESTDTNTNPKTFKFITLGCKVNQYESQIMAQELEKIGYIATTDKIADVCVVNTCTVTAVSDKKCRQEINRARRANPNCILIVAGCLVENSFDELQTKYDFDIVIHNEDKKNIAEILTSYMNDYNIPTPSVTIETADSHTTFDGIRATGNLDHSRANIKVQDGCRNFCAYCIIPYVRGVLRSKPLADCVDEYIGLCKNGYKEIVITGIHLTSYGRDLSSGDTLSDLLESLCTANSNTRIRLGSLEPSIVTPKFVDLFLSHKNLMPHFHLSLQSGCNKTLNAMNRHYTAEQYNAAVNLLREKLPAAAITTDILVGFPSESEADFAESLDFVKSIGFLHAHIFPYSIRKGTKAALMGNQVNGNIKSERAAAMQEVSTASQLSFYEKYIGHTFNVLFESVIDNDIYEGYSENYIPIRIKSDINISNTVFPVVITSIEGGHCLGRIV